MRYNAMRLNNPTTTIQSKRYTIRNPTVLLENLAYYNTQGDMDVVRKIFVGFRFLGRLFFDFGRIVLCILDFYDRN